MCRISDLELALEEVIVYVEGSPFVVQVVLRPTVVARAHLGGRAERTLILRPNFMAGGAGRQDGELEGGNGGKGGGKEEGGRRATREKHTCWLGLSRLLDGGRSPKRCKG